MWICGVLTVVVVPRFGQDEQLMPGAKSTDRRVSRHRRRVAIEAAVADKERTYSELVRGEYYCLKTLVLEVGERFS